MERAKLNMRTVEPSVVALMRKNLPVQNDAALMETFGISYNTWRKVRDGQLIRSSVAQRLEQRLYGNAHLIPRLKRCLEQALEIADRLDLTIVGAWISSAIESAPNLDDEAHGRR